MTTTFSNGYIRATTPQELRQEIHSLMRGKAWQQLATEGHPVIGLLVQAADSLLEVRDAESSALKGSPMTLSTNLGVTASYGLV